MARKAWTKLLGVLVNSKRGRVRGQSDVTNRTSQYLHGSLVHYCSQNCVPRRLRQYFHQEAHMCTPSYFHPFTQRSRSLCTMASREASDETSRPTADDAAWEALEEQMQAIRGGITRGLALDELKAAVDQLEPFATLDDLRFGEACLAVAQAYASSGEEAVEFLGYGERALKAFVSKKQGSSGHAYCLYLIGYGHFQVEKYHTAVVYLEECLSAIKGMAETAQDSYCQGLEPEVQATIGQAKMLLAKPLEALAHYQNFIELKEKLLNPGDPELAAAHLQAAHAFRGAKDVDGAMSLCSKALEVYGECYGQTSPQVAEVRTLLSGLYSDLGKYKEALTEYDAARPILEQDGNVQELAYLNLSSAQSLLNLQSYDEAITRLEEVIRDTDVIRPLHFNALLMAAKASATMKRRERVADYCKKALDALEKCEASTEMIMDSALLALVYEEEREFEQAAQILVRAKEASEKLGQSVEHLPAFAVTDLEGKIGFLLLRAGRVDKAIPYLKRSLQMRVAGDAQKLLHALFYLGTAYLQSRRLQEGLEKLEGAKKLLCDGVKVDAPLKIAIYDNIATVHRSCGRFDEAIECQKIAVDLIKHEEVQEADFDVEGVVARLEAYVQESSGARA